MIWHNFGMDLLINQLQFQILINMYMWCDMNTAVFWDVMACSLVHILCSRVHASWINVSNCPTRCNYIQFHYISANSSTCFGWYPHPSSGTHVNCNYSIWHWLNRICYRPLSWSSSSNSSTIADGSRYGLTSDRCCRYSCVCSWWWVKVPPETSTAV